MKLIWKKLSETQQKADYITVLHKNFLMPNGVERNYATIHSRHGAACTFAITKENKIIIARQFRPGLEKIMEELPGGGIDPGEDPLAAAKRELLEETGFSGKFEKLAETARDGYTDGIWHYFLATDCEKVQEPNHDEFEFIEVDTITVDRLLDNITNARMTDPTLALLALRRLGW